jgi:hypothetical protein
MVLRKSVVYTEIPFAELALKRKIHLFAAKVAFHQGLSLLHEEL